MLQAAENPDFNFAAAILTRFSFGRLPPSRLTTMLLNVILMYFGLTTLPSLSLAFSFLFGMCVTWNKISGPQHRMLTYATLVTYLQIHLCPTLTINSNNQILTLIPGCHYSGFSHSFGPLANYADRATAASWRSSTNFCG
jgi:hypothetical protein